MVRTLARQAKTAWIIGLFALGLVVPGPVAATEAKDVVREAVELAKTAKDWGYEQKERLSGSMESKLEALDAQIGTLRKKLDDKTTQLTDSARAKATDALRELEARARDAREKAGKLKESTQEAWQASKSGVAAAVDELAEAYSRAAAHFTN